ncbi:hypothetical protein Leryth_019303 [Lithospermum erythrorhizon]|nr:hypothetical protein Leryth_019303 [Lithospermum erythrorhizon]
MECSRLFLLFLVVLCGFLILGTHQLQPSQTQVLLQLRKQLEYPKALEIWNNDNADLCYLASSSQMNVTCENNFVSEVRIIGDKHERERDYNGFAVAYFTLSQNFSMDSLVATLSRLTSLKVLSLVSLGLWGHIPDKIFRLNSLEHLDLSWNYLYGSVPLTMSRMVKLKSLDLDGNFINGTFPVWFDSLSNLSSLSLKSNMLNGKFHDSIAKIATLSYIGFSNNQISGELPDFSSLDSLKMLELCNNKFDSELPGLPKGLVMAFLCNNSFSGEIPQRYSQLNQLQQLDLSDNNLEGSLSAALFALPSISYLNLSSNKLSGSFPGRFRCGSELGQVDIANNRLRGQLPSCLSALSGNDKVVKVDGNCLATNSRKGQHPETFCVEEEQVGEEESKSNKRINLGVLVGVIIAIVSVLSILGSGFIVLCRTYCPRGSSEQHLLHKAVHDNSGVQFPSELLMNARFIPDTSMLGAEGIPAHRLFSFEELKEATNNFDKSNLMGEGSTGKIFRGQLQNSGMRVAIRCLRVSKKYTMRNFKIRLDLLAKLRHPNLVCLLGHCLNEEERSYPGASKVYLVYEYVSGWTFRAGLSENDQEKILKWSGRLAILTSIAKAVHFLHTGVIPGFFSNRLKANNILINEHGIAKLSDYGLSIIQEEIDTREVNAEGLKSWQMKSLEDDIYSFGAILLESIARLSGSSRTDSFLIDQMQASFETRRDDQKQLLDNAVLESSSRDSLSIVISITRKCISLESGSRPSFEDILWNLQYASQVQANADNGDNRTGMQLQ